MCIRDRGSAATTPALPPSDALPAAAAAAAAAAASPTSSTPSFTPPPPRVVVFARSEREAKRAAEPLRAALWQQHALSVLLPSGESPVRALHAFRDRAASLLLATPSAARGLDLPAVSAVYCLGPPPSAAEYAHRAGRAGRVGSAVPGARVTSVVTAEELPRLLECAAEAGLGEGEESVVEVVDESDASLGLAPLMPQALEGEEGGDEEANEEDEEATGDGGGDGGEDDKAAAANPGSDDGKKAEGLESLRRGLDDLYNLM
jgi:superfamily II DNA/RNA helicase